MPRWRILPSGFTILNCCQSIQLNGFMGLGRPAPREARITLQELLSVGITLSGWRQGDGYRVGFGQVTARLLPPVDMPQ